MFFSLLYLFTIAAILVFTVLMIHGIIKERPITKWLAGLAGVTLFYVLMVTITVIT